MLEHKNQKIQKNKKKSENIRKIKINHFKRKIWIYFNYLVTSEGKNHILVDFYKHQKELGNYRDFQKFQ